MGLAPSRPERYLTETFGPPVPLAAQSLTVDEVLHILEEHKIDVTQLAFSPLLQPHETGLKDTYQLPARALLWGVHEEYWGASADYGHFSGEPRMLLLLRSGDHTKLTVRAARKLLGHGVFIVLVRGELSYLKA